MIPTPYIDELHAVLPRLLALYDVSPLSPTRGFGDRQYWAWKVSDFPNATFQGTAHGLARLLAAEALPDGIGERAVLARIEAQFDAFTRLCERDGSVGEAYPREASFCVSALVLFDFLCAEALLGDRLSPARRAAWRAGLAATARFVAHTPETHGFIANHLATGAAALSRWSALTGEHAPAAEALLARVLDAQSAEGWYPEYGGADPGYQSLCLYYLADIHVRAPTARLGDSLARALAFLRWFAHPDGSYGGVYGWRGTRFLCPAGLELLAPGHADARALAAFARAAIAGRRVPTLAVFDDPNLPVMFNAWACAATVAQPLGEPAPAPVQGRAHFPAAGLIVDTGPTHHTVVSWKRGGAFLHFRDGARAAGSGGVVARDADGQACTSQTMHTDVAARLEGDVLEIDCPLRPITQRPPTPWQFALLRLLAVTVFRWPWLNRLFKQFAARYLLQGLAAPRGTARRCLHLGPELHVEDHVAAGDLALDAAASAHPFNALHMASQGYWQRDDDS